MTDSEEWSNFKIISGFVITLSRILSSNEKQRETLRHTMATHCDWVDGFMPRYWPEKVDTATRPHKEK